MNCGELSLCISQYNSKLVSAKRAENSKTIEVKITISKNQDHKVKRMKITHVPTTHPPKVSNYIEHSKSRIFSIKVSSTHA